MKSISNALYSFAFYGSLGGDSKFITGGSVAGDRNAWEQRYRLKDAKRAGRATFQGKVYNFLERPAGWKCFIYHFSV